MARRHLVSGLAGHLHIEEDEVGQVLAAFDNVQSLVAVHGGRHDEAERAQQPFDDELPRP
jgi:energy-converting hydrogenase A subunit M